MHIHCVTVSTPGSDGSKVNESLRAFMNNEIEYLKVMSSKDVTVSNFMVLINEIFHLAFINCFPILQLERSAIEITSRYVRIFAVS
jgi:hypothetical protein